MNTNIKNKKYHTYAEAKVIQIDKPSIKSVKRAHAVFDRIGVENLSQEDLMYVKSVLVTAGVNGNDDIFFIDELWNARYSPILKPLDWMHNSSNIIGVMYSSVAKDVKTGNFIDLEGPSPSDPFELVTEGVVYKLLFPDKAVEIQEKAAKGELFVSMECWFDDYSYVLFDSQGKIYKVIERNKETAFLDENLKAFGGSGKYKADGEDLEYRIGRGLIGAVMGGCGFVYKPANSRSLIEDVGNFPVYKDNMKDLNDNVVDLLGALNNFVNMQERVVASKCDEEVSEMTDKPITKEDIRAAIDECEATKKAEAELEEIKEQAAMAATLKKQKGDLESQIKLQNSKLDSMLSSFTDSVKVIVQTVGKVGLDINPKDTTKYVNTPQEIEKIDIASSGDDAFNAKIDWISKSHAFLVDIVSKLGDKAAVANKLEKEIRETKAKARVDEVKNMFEDILEGDEIETFIEKTKAMSDDEYSEWKGEKELLIAKMKKEYQKKSPNDMKKEKMKDEKKMDDEKKIKEEKEINAKTDKGCKADKQELEEEDNTDETLDNAEAEEFINLAAAESENAKGSNGMKQAVAYIFGNRKNKKDEDRKANFDPVE